MEITYAMMKHSRKTPWQLIQEWYWDGNAPVITFAAFVTVTVGVVMLGVL